MLIRPIASIVVSLPLLIMLGSPAIGDMSLKCVYEVMVGAYHNVSLCGGIIDPDSRTRFFELRSSLEIFINKHARTDRERITSDHDEKTINRLRSKSRSELCESPDYALLREALKRMLAQDQVEGIRRRLATPSDPSEGDCL
jgi:hypothetical protein